jgi:hypothetical protein
MIAWKVYLYKKQYMILKLYNLVHSEKNNHFITFFNDNFKKCDARINWKSTTI